MTSTPSFDAPGLRQDEHPRTPDPDLDGLDAIGSEPTDLDSIEAELTAKVAETTVINVLGRPGYAVRCRTDFTSRDLDNLRKRCKDKRFVDKIDGIKFAALLLAFTAVAIVRHGKDLELDGASPVTFTSPELQTLYRTPDAQATVRAFYGAEGHIDAASRKLLEEAGWGDEADTADPTE